MIISQDEAMAAVRTLIEYLGCNPEREGLKGTPRRFVRMLDEFREKSEEDIILTTFMSQHDEMIIVKDIPLYSLCEHHLLPYTGTAHIGYVPREQILGLSKFARIVVKVSSGPTVQETLTRDIASAIGNACGSPDVAVVTEATHSCMSTRGVRVSGVSATMSCMQGIFRTNDSTRAEFLRLTA